MKNSKKFKELSDKEQNEILKIPEGLHEYRTTIRLLINHLLKSNMKGLFLLENKGRSWVYTNEIPDDALIDFISGVFIDDPHLMNMVMKEYNNQMGINDTKKENKELEQSINSEEPLNLTKETKPAYKDREEMPESVKFPDPQPDDYLTPKDLEEKYQLAPKTLANWRSQGSGPEFFKLGKKVRYLRKNVEKWVEQSRVKIYNKKQ